MSFSKLTKHSISLVSSSSFKVIFFFIISRPKLQIKMLLDKPITKISFSISVKQLISAPLIGIVLFSEPLLEFQILIVDQLDGQYNLDRFDFLLSSYTQNSTKILFQEQILHLIAYLNHKHKPLHHC